MLKAGFRQISVQPFYYSNHSVYNWTYLPTVTQSRCRSMQPVVLQLARKLPVQVSKMWAAHSWPGMVIIVSFFFKIEIIHIYGASVFL
jgi:hypothetical protein